MRDDRYYRNILNKDYMLNVIHAAPLHDIGKIAIPDSILQKPGKLTAAEYEIMKQHAATGGDIILQTFYNLDDADFRQIAYEVARFHHENLMEKATQTDWQGSRSRFTQESWQSQMYLMQFPRNAATGMPCRWKRAFLLLKKEAAQILIPDWSKYFWLQRKK